MIFFCRLKLNVRREGYTSQEGGIFHRFIGGLVGKAPKLAIFSCIPHYFVIAAVTWHVIGLSLNQGSLADVFWQSAVDIRYFHLCLTPTEVVLNFYIFIG